MLNVRIIFIVKKFIEMPPDDESKEWTGARENYSLIEKENKNKIHLFDFISVLPRIPTFLPCYPPPPFNSSSNIFLVAR